jgi:hypothetical protein
LNHFTVPLGISAPIELATPPHTSTPRKFDQHFHEAIPYAYLFKEEPKYEHSAARTVHGLRENRSCVWSRQPLKIEQLHCCG